MKFNQIFRVELLSRKSMYVPADAINWFQLHFDMLPSMYPHKWDFDDPLRRLPPENNDWSGVIEWRYNTFALYWKRLKKVRSWGLFDPASPMRGNKKCSHARERIDIELSQVNLAELTDYMIAATQANLIDIGGCDLGGYDYMWQVSEFRRGSWRGFDLARARLNHWLDDLYWITIFGKPYVKLFGMEKLLSAPCYKVTQISDEAVMLQLSESPADLIDQAEAVRRIKESVKQHLNPNAFFSFDKAYHLYGAGKYSDSEYEQSMRGSVFDVPEFEILRDEFFDPDVLDNAIKGPLWRWD